MVNKYVGAGQAVIGVGKKVIQKLSGQRKTTADQAFNYIPTGDKEKVRGTKRMLANKKKEATWY